MKGIILAGGVGSRLMPITHIINKNLLPIYNKPGIFYSIELLANSGVNEICIIAANRFIDDYKDLLGNGTDFRVKLFYESDTPVKKGPASAVYYAKDFTDNNSVIVVFADCIYDVSVKKDISEFTKGAKIFVKKVDNPSAYGVVELDQEFKVISIEEKPEKPKSHYALTGLGMYDKNLFNYIEKIEPGINGEYYMTDVDKIYLDDDNLEVSILDGFWQDIGTFDGMLEASNYWAKKLNSKKSTS